MIRVQYTQKCRLRVTTCYNENIESYRLFMIGLVLSYWSQIGQFLSKVLIKVWFFISIMLLSR